MGKLIEQLKRHEGFRATPYKCTAGKWTIGYGYNLDAVAVDHDGLVWNESFAEYILRKEVFLCSQQISMFFNNMLGGRFESLNKCRFDALVNMSFNIGINRLSKFEKMWAAIDKEDYETAAKEMLDSKWSRQVGDRSLELADQMKTGKWQQ